MQQQKNTFTKKDLPKPSHINTAKGGQMRETAIGTHLLTDIILYVM